MSTRIAFTESSSLVPTTLFAISGSLAVGDAVCQVAGADKTVAKADADNASARPPIGVVHEIRGTDAVVALNGEVAAGLTGLTRGTAYWLSTTAGALVATKPATNAYLVGVAVSASELLVNTVAADLVIGGGGGSVTSFGVTSSDITVSNSPITSSGVIDLALNTVPVSKGGTGLTSATEQGASLIASSSSAYVAQATSLSWRNRIINGDMRVAQRGTAAVTLAGNHFIVDRMICVKSPPTGGTVLGEQSSVAPVGFSNSLRYYVTAPAASVPSSAYIGIYQFLEGTNTCDFAWGTAAARPVAVSFWVRSSVTGTYCISIGTAGVVPRRYVAEYTISAKDTWERKVISVPGDAAQPLPTNNTGSIALNFDLGSGSSWTTTANSWQNSSSFNRTANQVSFVTAPIVSPDTSNSFYLTGVQLELGSVATPFEMLQYEKQLELCQRYYARLSSLSGSGIGFGAGCYPSNTSSFVYIKYPQTMRSTPTVFLSNVGTSDTAARTITWSTMYYGDSSMMATGTRTSASSTLGRGCVLVGSTSTSYIELNAEL